MPAKLFATLDADPEALVMERHGSHEAWRLRDGQPMDLLRSGPGRFSVVHKGRSYDVLVLKEDAEANTWRLRIGSHVHTVKLEDERAKLLELLGVDRSARSMMRELKAPMPGLVLKVMVKAGESVRKNDPLLVLEAMKMENVIKSPGDATVKQVHADERSAVEKGQLLMSFE